MLVYNLSDKVLAYRGKDIPSGSSREFPELDTFIPTRDKQLAEQKVISFGYMPSWWHPPKVVVLKVVEPPLEPPKKLEVKTVDVVKVSDRFEGDGKVERRRSGK